MADWVERKYHRMELIRDGPPMLDGNLQRADRVRISIFNRKECRQMRCWTWSGRTYHRIDIDLGRSKKIGAPMAEVEDRYSNG
jgi:hypothetical protein